MIQRLVVNGCSYMKMYGIGGGHTDLAARLQIPNNSCIAIPGSANSKIIRTTLRDMYSTDVQIGRAHV